MLDKYKKYIGKKSLCKRTYEDRYKYDMVFFTCGKYYTIIDVTYHKRQIIIEMFNDKGVTHLLIVEKFNETFDEPTQTAKRIKMIVEKYVTRQS